MGIDLRKPIGILFLAYGALLAVYGVARPHPVLDLNINLIWGCVMAAFGAVMLALALRKTVNRKP
jgi:hypothetical protein